MPIPGEPPPEPMPVDQSGETVVFVQDGDFIEAHIQIEYDADADAQRFAWLIPLPTLPEFGISSEALFQQLQLATVPVFGYSSSTDTCSSGDSGGSGGWGDSGGTSSSGGSDGSWGTSGGSSAAGDPDSDCSPFGAASATTAGGGNFSGTSAGSSTEGSWGDGEAGSSGGDGGSYGGDDDGGESGEPEVIQHGLVGAFEIFTLEGGTVDGVMTWLEENDFEPDPDAEPIIEDYLNAGHVFVAMKLAPGGGATAVHPIRLRFEGAEFCVPLKITAIAAKDDMAIRVMVLGVHRAAPANWPSVVLNPLAYNWLELAPEYENNTVVSIDQDPVEGHGWVTEYAGSSGIVDAAPILNPLWDPAALEDVTPFNFVETLQAQGLIGACDSSTGSCEALHPLGPSLLDEFLPVPEGIEPYQFYGCVQCFTALIDFEAFNMTKLGEAISSRIIEPAEHAQALLASRPYLTRLYTRISPHEMTEDPTFHFNPDLPNVPLPTMGHRSSHCDETYDFVVNNTLVEMSHPDQWPTFDGMPLATRVEMIPAVGAPQVVVDNSAQIAQVLQTWNDGVWGDNSEGQVKAARTSRADEQCGGCACSTNSSRRFGLGALMLMAFGRVRRRRMGA